MIQARLQRLDRSLEIYAAAIGALLREKHLAEQGQTLEIDEQNLLIDRLLACQGAPYVSSDVLTQIDAYTAEGWNASRLSLLLKTLERESQRMLLERATWLKRIEQPGWGRSLWQQMHHMLPFLFFISVFVLSLWFVHALLSLNGRLEGGFELFYIICRFISCLFSLLLLYPFVRTGRRETPGTLLQRLLAVLISLAVLLHFIGLSWSPYVLLLQLLLYLLGFRFSDHRPRRSRPYVGHYWRDDENWTSDADDSN